MRTEAVRLRLTDAASFTVLTEHFRSQAEICHQMARITVSPFKQGWLEFAAEWTKLARETKAKARLNHVDSRFARSGNLRDLH